MLAEADGGGSSSPGSAGGGDAAIAEPPVGAMRRAATLTAEEREQEDKRKNTVRSSGDPVAEIVEQCRASGTKFTDHEFSGDAALYENPRHPKNRAGPRWARFPRTRCCGYGRFLPGRRSHAHGRRLSGSG